jgi:hypothetical protein
MARVGLGEQEVLDNVACNSVTLQYLLEDSRDDKCAFVPQRNGMQAQK